MSAITVPEVQAFIGGTSPGGADVVACVAALEKLQDVSAFGDFAALTAFAKARSEAGKGQLIVACIRVYAQPSVRAPGARLADVYSWAHFTAPKLYPSTGPDMTELPKAFLLGRANAARSLASELYGDCYLVLASFVAAWNRRQIRQVA